jgi:hypothetical protein
VAHRKLAIIRRRVFTALSVLPLLLCVATLALWARSYFRADHVSYTEAARPGQARWVAVSARGRFHAARVTYLVYQPHGWRWASAPDRSLTIEDPTGALAGIGVSLDPRSVTCPYALSAFILAILSTPWVLTRVRHAIRPRLHRAGHCPRCGYDLRATPDRCPECGAGRDVET